MSEGVILPAPTSNVEFASGDIHDPVKESALASSVEAERVKASPRLTRMSNRLKQFQQGITQSFANAGNIGRKQSPSHDFSKVDSLPSTPVVRRCSENPKKIRKSSDSTCYDSQEKITLDTSSFNLQEVPSEKLTNLSMRSKLSRSFYDLTSSERLRNWKSKLPTVRSNVVDSGDVKQTSAIDYNNSHGFYDTEAKTNVLKSSVYSMKQSNQKAQSEDDTYDLPLNCTAQNGVADRKRANSQGSDLHYAVKQIYSANRPGFIGSAPEPKLPPPQYPPQRADSPTSSIYGGSSHYAELKQINAIAQQHQQMMNYSLNKSSSADQLDFMAYVPNQTADNKLYDELLLPPPAKFAPVSGVPQSNTHSNLIRPIAFRPQSSQSPGLTLNAVVADVGSTPKLSTSNQLHQLPNQMTEDNWADESVKMLLEQTEAYNRANDGRRTLPLRQKHITNVAVKPHSDTERNYSVRSYKAVSVSPTMEVTHQQQVMAPVRIAPIQKEPDYAFAEEFSNIKSTNKTTTDWLKVQSAYQAVRKEQDSVDTIQIPSENSSITTSPAIGRRKPVYLHSVQDGEITFSDTAPIKIRSPPVKHDDHIIKPLPEVVRKPVDTFRKLTPPSSSSDYDVPQPDHLVLRNMVSISPPTAKKRLSLSRLSHGAEKQLEAGYEGVMSISAKNSPDIRKSRSAVQGPGTPGIIYRASSQHDQYTPILKTSMSNLTSTPKTDHSSVAMPPDSHFAHHHSDHTTLMGGSHLSQSSRNSSGIHVTPSPSDSALAEAEILLREKETEITVLRRRMEENDKSFFAIIQDKEQHWQLQISEWSTKLERSLNSEKSLKSQLDHLQVDKQGLHSRIEDLLAEKQGLQRKCKELENEYFELQRKIAEKQQKNVDNSFSLCKGCGQMMSLANNGHQKAKHISPFDLPSSATHSQRNSSLGDATSVHRTSSGHDDRISINTDSQKSPTPAEQLRGEMDSLRTEVSSLRDTLHSQIHNYSSEKVKWEEEKSKVVQYQQMLHNNYLNVLKRNRALEDQLNHFKIDQDD